MAADSELQASSLCTRIELNITCPKGDSVLYNMQGLVAGSARSAADLLAANVEALRRNNTVRWAYFSPSVQVPPLFGKNKDFKIYGN